MLWCQLRKDPCDLQSSGLTSTQREVKIPVGVPVGILVRVPVGIV